MSKRSIQRNIARNQKHKGKSRRGGNPNVARPTIQKMTYRTTFWKTPEGKKRSKTELVERIETKTPVLPMTEASHEVLPEPSR